MQNRIILLLFLVAIVLSIVGLYFFVNPAMVEEKNELSNITVSTKQEIKKTSGEDVQKKPDNVLYTGKQSPGRSVTIDLVILKKGGFVVVMSENTFESTWEIVGVSKYLKAGEYKYIQVPLVRRSVNGEVFNARLHGDDGDTVFNMTKDTPLVDENGNSYFTNIEMQSLSH